MRGACAHVAWLGVCAQVYGPRDNLFLPNLLEAAGSGRLRVFGNGQNRICFTHVDNYAHGLIIAERALTLWNNEYFLAIIKEYRESVLPILFNALHTNVFGRGGKAAPGHWNQTVVGLTQNVVKVFMEIDPIPLMNPP